MQATRTSNAARVAERKWLGAVLRVRLIQQGMSPAMIAQCHTLTNHSS